jgi:hypothetical protein
MIRKLMMMVMVAVAALITGCATPQQQSNTQSTPPQAYASPCLHKGDCANRPFPGMRTVSNEPWRSGDEGAGNGGGDGK